MESNFDIIQTYNQLVAYGQDPWWSATRALTIKYALSVEWERPTLEIGGQNGIVSNIIGRPIDLMVDTEPEFAKWPANYRMVSQGNAECMDIPDNQYNSIVMLNAIYHCNRYKVLSECYRILKKDGMVVLTDSPGYNDILTWSYLARKFGDEKSARKLIYMELDMHGVNIVPGEWWDWLDKNMWETIAKKSFGSRELCLVSRAYYTIRNLIPQIGIPTSELLEGVIELAYQSKKIPEWLEQDEKMCENGNAVFLFIVLKKLRKK